MDLLADKVNENTTLVTVSRRLSRHLRERFGVQQQAQKEPQQAWLSPDILPWSSWVEREFQRLRGLDVDADEDIRVLLQPHQELKIWQQIIETDIDEPSDHVYQVAATASAVANARRTARQWQIDLNALDTQSAPDAARFDVWNQRFDAYIDAHVLISAADAQAELLARFRAGAEPGIATLVHAGFDELTPLQQSLFDALQANGVSVVELETQEHDADIVRLQFESAQQELDCIAAWAHGTLVAEPEASIAVVCADLQNIRKPLARTLTEALEGHHAGAGLLELSQGTSLDQMPMIRAAFASFALLDRRVDVDEIGVMLNSTFFLTSDSEACQRARLDVALRSRRRKSIGFDTLHYLLAEHPELSVIAPDFSKLIKNSGAYREKLAQQASRQRATDWAEQLNAFLLQLGWPGERKLDALEQQVQNSWNDLLTRFCALDLVVQPMSLSDAISELTSLAEDSLHQTRAKATPVQIMGVNESAGLAFTHLWVVGMSEDVWPPPSRPMSFLPTQLQRNAGLSSASAEQVYRVSRRATDRLKSAAPTVVFSHVSRNEDLAKRPSPLIADIQLSATPPQQSAEAFLQRARLFDSQNSAALERYDDQTAPALASGVSGGTSLFSDQAKCPFRAFARHRLNARGLEVLGDGLDPLERGQIVHDILEEIWGQQLKSHAQLAALDESALAKLVGDVVRRILNDPRRQAEQLMSVSMQELEQQRLQSLIQHWLVAEKKRTDDFVVDAVEANAKRQIGGLTITLRADRIDRVEVDGEQRYVIIDYKTGNPSISDWQSERPTELQLPIYAQALGFEQVDSIAYARVRVGEQKFAGVSSGAGNDAEGIRDVAKRFKEFEDWQSFSQHLNDAIEQIGTEICDGHASVDPMPRVCERCDLTPLCRISRWNDGLEEHTDTVAVDAWDTSSE